MLTALNVRDVVLIDTLDIAFQPGLSVLTGETGAGKSILLDALGLALGARADAGLVRAGADRASVTATFDLADDHPARRILGDRDISAEDVLVLRRVVGADGRSRAFVNDQPVSIGLLRRLGESLVEIQGQFGERGLTDRATHRALLDAYGGLAGLRAETAAAHGAWQDAKRALAEAEAEAAKARQDEAFLRHAAEELERLAPETGEEKRLDEIRTMLMHAENLAEGIATTIAELEDEDGAESRLRRAARRLAGVAELAAGRLDDALAALDRAVVETAEALRALHGAVAEIEADSGRLEEVEERLFALRDLARKHGVAVDALPRLAEDIAARLALVDDRSAALAQLETTVLEARNAYLDRAERLSAARREAAERLDDAVAAELTPLRLDKARFLTRIERLEEGAWGPDGLDRVEFLAVTNPGAPPAPLAKIASGGELSRFMLALKVALAEIGTVPTLIFDEVDSNVGGATAAAVGERLERLAERFQVLVVTHSPQVAARGGDHFRVEKREAGSGVATRVQRLDAGARREEVARMLSGRSVTDEARGAAARLLQGETA